MPIHFSVFNSTCDDKHYPTAHTPMYILEQAKASVFWATA